MYNYVPNPLRCGQPQSVKAARDIGSAENGREVGYRRGGRKLTPFIGWSADREEDFLSAKQTAR
jgi:hypothetical protein